MAVQSDKLDFSQPSNAMSSVADEQRRKLFEFDERNWTLIERSEMINGRSNHAFVEIPMTGELVAIGGWDGERAMA